MTEPALHPATQGNADLEKSSTANKTTTVVTLDNDESTNSPDTQRGFSFWVIFFALFLSFFTVCLEGTIVSTALPTIAESMHISQFAWVGTAFGLPAAAFLPLAGALAEVFGRKPLILWSLVIFAVGGAVGGAAPNPGALFTARIIQGIGSGCILTSCEIIIADLVPLSKRGAFLGFLGLAWCFGSAIGPIIGGSLAQEGQWRWLFYLNIPLSGFAFCLVILTLKVPTPKGSMKEKLSKIDWIGALLIIGGASGATIGLTWGGIQFPWSSARVLSPLCIGFACILAFFPYEAWWAKHPLAPIYIMNNRTTISGYVQTTILSLEFLGLLYFLPVYFQACKGSDPVASGVDLLAFAFSISPVALISGASVTATKRYRPQLWLGWILLIIGCGLLSTLKADSSRAKAIGFQIICGIGMGLMYALTRYPILAPVPVASNAHALSFFVFLRALSQIWGIVIGSTILQNQLKQRLPPTFSSSFAGGVEIAYAAIPLIPNLPSPTQQEVREAFADSLAVLWETYIALTGVGLLASFLMRGIPLHTETDKKWDLETKEKETGDIETK